MSFDYNAPSPSTRRAWIEIEISKEKLDSFFESPSTRRAWIEITAKRELGLSKIVALHPEGVDRNPGTMPVVDGDIGRPPPGGRG